ncbi:histone-lysine N-methyltransferase, H3 lysine-9 specific SUVH6-like [Dorcoceras hygrometricum]|uniref:Histone-lysine N-methyltransferase, H3 lysine-9 specific SUVH6-like n=1 Tax=Dorcoceras hygrometricum TaxID=472368 RepID=A0A2Z7D436_9LAMI|nr:histone-lysine N-methyltransferase, H3 lysine-9 specific SUVH6-like [Dorcoceras hygrometricum]
MASISDFGLFGEVPNKRPLENGFVPVPKYKPRKVSAVRDFPPGCGPLAVPSDLKRKENGCRGAGVSESDGVYHCHAVDAARAHGVESFLPPSPVESDRGDILKSLKLDGIKNSQIVKDEGPSGVNVSSIEVDCGSRCIRDPVDKEVVESVDALVEDVPATAIDCITNVEEVVMEIGGPICNELPNEVEVQTLKELDQSLGSDDAESLDASVGKLNTTDGFSDGVSKITDSDSSKEEIEPEGQITLEELGQVEASVLVPNSFTEESSSVFDARASLDELPLVGFSWPSTSSHGNSKLGASAMKNDKYHPRRVSAVRDFPPRCGTNNWVPTVRKQQTDTSEKDDFDGLKEVGIKFEMNETSTSKSEEMHETNTTENRATVACELVSFEDCNGVSQESNIEETDARQYTAISGTSAKADNRHSTSPMAETAVPSIKRSAAIRPTDNDFGSDDNLHRLVVHGLSAAPFCPWRKGKISSNDLHGESTAGKSKNHTSFGKRKSKAVTSNRNLQADSLGHSSTKKGTVSGSHDEDGNSGSSMVCHKEDHDIYDEDLPYLTPAPIQAIPGDADEDSAGPVGKEIVVYEPETCDNMTPLHDDLSLKHEVEREVVVHGPYFPSTERKIVSEKSGGVNSRGKVRNQKISLRKKMKAVSKKISSELNSSGGLSMKQKEDIMVHEEGRPKELMQMDEADPDHHGDLPANSSTIREMQDIGVSLPPFGPNYSSQGDARNRVRETLRLFHAICRKLLQKEEANSMPDEEGNSREFEKKSKRIDLVSAKIIKHKGKEVNTDKLMFGQVPGVEVGDEFQYRVELAIVGIHRLYQAGIDWMKVNGEPVATSIVASGAYSDDLENADVLIYSGQGGNVVGKTKQPEDQKLERGNLALRNSISAGTPVRVVRGWKETKTIDPTDSRPKTVTIYVYDGLYTVTRYWTEVGPRGKQVFMFELRRNPGQPELAWKQLKNSNKSRTRPGVCVSDISGGKEPFPILAVNIIDDEKPPPFNYTPKMIYPDWFCPISPKGCNCTGRCSDTKKCPCAVRNGGEIPYNRNGAIVEAKPLVFECGPSCNCPPSCYNRVTQRGIRVKLEIFKTISRGWGLRSITSIPSGSFICEYAGELLEEKEAEQRVGNDEYLFDIGQNFDLSLNAGEQAIPVESMEEAESGYTIDAGQYGNVGRFVNHSCSPNLYAQNVIYDHDDKRMPHVMLFAAENIPPLQELTYHYNYAVDQVRDSNGNIKIKKCYCGSAECSGRMY